MNKKQLQNIIKTKYEDKKGCFRKNIKFFSASKHMQELIDFTTRLPEGELNDEKCNDLQFILLKMNGRDFRNLTGKVFEHLKCQLARETLRKYGTAQ